MATPLFSILLTIRLVGGKFILIFHTHITNLVVPHLKLKVLFIKLLPDAYIVIKNCSMEVAFPAGADSLLLVGTVVMVP